MKAIVLAVIGTAVLMGCDEAERIEPEIKEADNMKVVEVLHERRPQCTSFYDPEEGGDTIKCLDLDREGCYTLYEVDGDKEYYCGDEKIWEIEPDDAWDGWDMAVGAVAGAAAAKATSKPKKAKSTTLQPKRPLNVAPMKSNTKPNTIKKANTNSKGTTTTTNVKSETKKTPPKPRPKKKKKKK